jgi:hypothetical protein
MVCTSVVGVVTSVETEAVGAVSVEVESSKSVIASYPIKN